MADNITLNSGSGGSTVRTLSESSGVENPMAVAAYATTVSDGANVIQIVTPSFGMPVAQQSAWTTAITQGGNTAVVDASGRMTVNAVQSGSWTTTVSTIDSVAAVTAITDPVTVIQPTAGNLLCTASIATGQTLDTVTNLTNIVNPVAVSQNGSWTLDSVTAVTAITNPVAATQSGTWNVGTVTAVTNITNPVASTQSGTWTVGLSAAQTLANVTTLGTITNAVTVAQPTASSLNATATLAAGTALIGKASASAETSTVYNGTTALTPKFAVISASSSGDNAVVASVVGKKIRVLRWSASANGTVSIKWRSATTDVTGLSYLIQYASAGGAYCPVGIFETASGEALNLNLSGAVAVGGVLTYLEI